MFKFREINKTTYEMFLNRELWCASPISLNDPFDSQFDYHAFSKKIAQLTKNKPRPLDINELTQHAKNTIENLGICSFSQKKNNQLMWSHYADEHRGLCIEFDVREILNRNSDLSFAFVNYQSELPELKLAEEFIVALESLKKGFDNIASDEFRKILKTKSIDWSYESEARIIKLEYGVIKFSPECILSISFGLRTSKKDILNIRKLLNHKDYSHVKWFRAKKSSINYDLDFERIID